MSAPAAAAEQHGVFQWYGARVAQVMEARAAMLFPVEIGGVHCIMQLDTAAATSMLYRPLLSEEIVQRLASAELRVTGSSGAYLVPPAGSMSRIDFGAGSERRCGTAHPGALVGTLGNDVFKDSALLLDLKNGSFDILDAAQMQRQGAGMDALPFAPDPALRGLPVVTLTDEAGNKRRMLVDTGSAPITAVLYYLDDWRRITGQQDLSKLESMQVTRWGKPALCYQAPAQVALSTEVVQVRRGDNIYYCNFMSDAVQEGNPVQGMLGMKPFGIATVVFDFSENMLRVRRQAE
ncbi:hypothetical protein [Massilia sp.]|uniref:hypothetical protein n=1 Tax=Massilia sp. TaxID=1882437 RepID=UPI0028A1AF0A|nr:hypothetical protein [Massilia sp.]